MAAGSLGRVPARFSVRILVRASHPLDKFIETLSMKPPRKGTLVLDARHVELGRTWYGEYLRLASLPLGSIRCVRFKEGAITRRRQIRKPLFTVGAIGLGTCLIAWFQDAPASIRWAVIIGSLVLLIMVGLLIFFLYSLPSLKDLAVVAFEGDDGHLLDVAIASPSLDDLLAAARDRNLLVGPLL